MRNQFDKFRKIGQMIAEERGSFWLFALFLREESPNRWDLVVSDPWVGEDRYAALDYTVGKVQEVLDPKEIIQLSHVAILVKESPVLEEVTQAI